MHSWVGTDFVKRQELVDNFVTIDTQMKVNKDAAATAQSTIDTHKALTAVIGTGTVKEKHISDQDYKNWEDHRANTSNPHNVTIAQIGAAAASHVGTGGSSHAAVTTTTNGFMISTDKSKLDGISTGANKTATSTVNGNILVDNVEKVVYTHPSTHPATMITEDTTHRFVTDTEKSTWNGKANTTVVTTSANGLMSSGDKTKLDGIATGAEVNQNAFSTVVAGGTSLVADAKSDSLTMTAGTGIVISGNATTDTVTITVDSTVETITGAQTKADQAEVNAINWAKGFGLGDVAKDISSTDLNNLDATGFYRGITLTNAPGGVSSAFFILNFKASATVKTQFAIRYNQSATDAYYWFRHNINGTWGGWIQVATTAVVTTAANGLMIATDKVKLDGIETGAQVNDVTSVAGKVGAVTLGPTDVGAAPVSHTHVAADLPSATTAAKGIVQLSDSTSTTSSVLAATSTAVKAAYDLAAGRATTAVATTSANGLMSSTDKSKLDGVIAGAQPNQNAFGNVTAGGVTIVADNVTDTLDIVAGSGISIIGDATNDRVTVGIDSTVSRVGHTHTIAGAEVTDVVITSVANDEVLAYDSTTAKWINQTPAEANLAIATRNILTGSGLTGGGNLTADRTLAVSFGGNGALTTVARSDHNHDTTYANLTGDTFTGTVTVNKTASHIQLQESGVNKWHIESASGLFKVVQTGVASKFAIDGTQAQFTTTLDMVNNSITNVNNITIADVGASEGIEWKSVSGLNNWKVVVTDDGGTGNDDNASYPIQFFRNGARMATIGTTGNIYGTGATVRIQNSGANNYFEGEGDAVLLKQTTASTYIAVGNDGANRVWSNSIWGRTYSSGTGIGTMAITDAGTIGRLSSSIRYKIAVEDVKEEAVDKILNLNPRTWFDKKASEQYAEWLTELETNPNAKLPDIGGNIRRGIGFIAEEVEALGLSEFVVYDKNENGGLEAQGLMYDRMWVYLVPIIKRLVENDSKQNAEINELKNELATVNEKLEKIMSALSL
jgi:hypothetical protein